MGDNSVYYVHEICEGIWAIEERHVRFFLITGRDRALLIDTGFGGGDLKELVRELTDLPLALAITHSDGDHIGGIGVFESAYMHPAEFEHFAKNSEGLKKPLLLPFWEGDILDLGGVKMEAVLIPGHTPGSIALFERNRNIMFTGDSVSKVPIFMFGTGRNIDAYICSMEKLKRVVSAGTKLFVSHGPMEQDPSLLPRLIEGAKALKAGKIKGIKPERDLPCLEYNCGKVKFYY